jgi:hypothetical protein
MIIVEGADRSGKTTLAQRLAEDTGREYMRPPKHLLSSRTGPGPGLMEWWKQQLIEMPDAVYDRSTFISDPIYASALNKPGCASPRDNASMVEAFIVRPENVVIFCRPREFPKFVESEQLEGLNAEMDASIIASYDFMYYVWRLLCKTTLLYDWTNYEDIHSAVLQCTGQIQRRPPA